METEQLVSEGIHHPGAALDQRIRLLDELNSYWLPIYILFNQFDRPANLKISIKEIRESTIELYDTRTGERVKDVPIYLRDFYLETPRFESFYRLLQYLDGVPKIGTVLPHFYASSLDNVFTSSTFLDSSISVAWRDGHDLSYLKVRLGEGLNKLFDEFEILRSLHESFATKTPPKVPVKILVQFRNLKNWKRFLVPMGLDIYSVISDKDYFFRLPSYYITNVHRLVDLETQVPPKILKGVLDRSNELIDKFNIPGLSHYRTSKTAWKKKRVSEPSWSDTSSLQPSSLKGSLTSVLNIGDSDTKFVVGLLALCLFVPILAYLLGN